MVIKACNFICVATLTVALISCKSTVQSPLYFTDIDRYEQGFQATPFADHEVVIEENNELSIVVSSTSVLNQEKVAQFNLPATVTIQDGESNLSKSPSYLTYIVDREGNINFPVIGKVKLAGLTRAEAIIKLEDAIAPYLMDKPVVNLSIISTRVTVLGEVSVPGHVYFLHGRMSLLDAIGAAGGITIFGKKDNVLLIRNNNNKVDHIRFDLTSAEIFKSPYFYLKQNDVVIVEPNKTQREEGNYGTADNMRFTRTSLVISTLSTISSLIVTTFLLLNQK
jgi:polysaccharide export outer membrane protein